VRPASRATVAARGFGGREGIDSGNHDQLLEWFNGSPPPDNTYGVILADLAQTMNGINMAGPKLTPDTFKAALYNAPVPGWTPLAPCTSRAKPGP